MKFWVIYLVSSLLLETSQFILGSVIVEPGPLDHFELIVPVVVRPGEDFQVIIEAKDALGNLIVDYSASGKGVNIFTDGRGKISPIEVLPWNFENGRAKVYFRYDTAEIFTIIAREKGEKHIQGVSLPIDSTVTTLEPVEPIQPISGEFDHFLVIAPRRVIAGQSFSLIIEARDKSNKLVTDYHLKGRDVELITSPSGMTQPILVKAESFKQGRAIVKFSCSRSGMITIIARQKQAEPVQISGARPEPDKGIISKTREEIVANVLEKLDEVLHEKQVGRIRKKTVTLNLKEADIKDVLRIISYETGINILAGANITGTVTVKLKDVSLDDALKSILYANGYTYVKEDNIYRVVESELITEVFILKYIDAFNVKDIIEGELSEAGKVEAYSPTQAGWDFGTGGTQSSGTTTTLGTEDITSTTSTSSSSISSITSGIGSAKRVRQALPASSRKSNILVVTDTPNIMARIRTIIAKLDVKPRQVLIEAKIVEVANTLTSKLGIDWEIIETSSPRYNITLKQELLQGLTDGLTVDLYKVGILHPGEYSATLDAIMTDTRSKVISSPLVVAVEHQEATILSGKVVPIIATTTVTGGTVSEQVQSVQEWINIGTQLLVVPQICEGGYVNLIIHPEVSDILEYTDTNPPFPIIETRQAESQVFVKSGDTVVIAGLVKKTDVKTVDKVPLLGDIPLLGFLFQKQTIDTEDRDMLIFITPHILTDERVGELTDR